MQLAGVAWAFMLAAAFSASSLPARTLRQPELRFDIAAQSLPAALQQFSRLAGLQIIYPYDAFAKLRSRRISGKMTVEKALHAMIKGLPVRVALIDEHMVALAPEPAPRRIFDGPSSLYWQGSKELAETGTEGTSVGMAVVPIVVTGRRVSRSSEAIGEGAPTERSAVTRSALLSAPSGISGLKMLELLPGFNVQTDGALGLYEFGNSVQVRAFNLDQIGFVLDGIPMGRSDPFGGSPVFRYVDNENLAVVEASSGAADVSLPSNASLGPLIEYRTIEPQTQAGLFVSHAVGDHDLRRSFVRLGTGRLGPVAAYLSRTKLNSNLWRGAGTIDREHWEGQALIALGGGNWARFKFVANNFFDYDSPALTLEEYSSGIPDLGGKTGRDRGFIGFIPQLPATTPGIPYSDSRYGYYYGNALNSRRDRLYGVTVHAGLGPGTEGELVFYHEDKRGFGVSPADYDNSLVYYLRQNAAGLPVSPPRGLQYGLSTLNGGRDGIRAMLHVRMGHHTLSAGIWAEEDRYRRKQLRLNRAGGAPDGTVLDEEVVYFRRDYGSRRQSLQLHLSDRIDFARNRGALTLGLKALAYDYRQRGFGDYDSYALPSGSPGFGSQVNHVAYADMFVPMASMFFRLGNRMEIFADYAENFALPKGMDDVFSVPSPLPLVAPRPENATNLEAGIRSNQPDYFASATLYFTRFRNRIQALSEAAPGSSGVTENYFRNVGRVEAYGIEFSGTVKPRFLDGLAYFYSSLAYNIARYLDDLPDGTVIAGNRLPDSAKWLVLAGITVEPAQWFIANMSGKYTSRRYANSINTRSLPGFAVFSAYVDIGEGVRIPPLRNVRARINVDNLFDKKALSFIAPSVTDDGLFRPLSPRTLQFTLSAEF